MLGVPFQQTLDDTLVTRIRTGDVGAFEHFFRATAPTAYRFSLSLTHDPDLAEDVVQDVFSWIWLNRSDWHPQGNPLTYVLGAIRNRALNATRNHKHRTEQMERAGGANEVPAMSAQPPAPDDGVHTDDLRTIVWSLAAELSEQRRTVLILRWYYTLPWTDIATIMEVSVNAVQVLHSRALADLRRRIPEWLRGG